MFPFAFLRSLLPRRIMAATKPVAANKPMAATQPPAHGGASATKSLTALNRWSVLGNRTLPAVDTIKHIHVYDFDNTLFKTPVPNPKLWHGTTLGNIMSPDIFTNGGWWHDARILQATGDGLEREEPRAWDGWWNEKVVELVRLTQQQDDALAVLLTGRAERDFADLLKRIVASKGLNFDLIGLKPAVGPQGERFTSTMHFKQCFLRALAETYPHAVEMRLYEDRPKHVAAFRAFLHDYNRQLEPAGPADTNPLPAPRGPLRADVVQVPELSIHLDPVVEVAEMQHLVNSHNELLARGEGNRRALDRGPLALKKTVLFTSYMIRPATSKRLLGLVALPRTGGPNNNHPAAELRRHANNIMICPRPDCPPALVASVGGLGAKRTWEVTATACLDNALWAAAVRPVPGANDNDEQTEVHTVSGDGELGNGGGARHHVVLACRRGLRPGDAARLRDQDWVPLPAHQAFTFETTVGEKVALRIEPEAGPPLESSHNRDYDGAFFAGKPAATPAAKRKYGGGGDGNGDGSEGGNGNGNGNFKYYASGNNPSSFRGGRGNQGRGGGGAFRGPGGGGRGYRTNARGNKNDRRGGRGGVHGYKSLDDARENHGHSNNSGNRNANANVSYDDGFPSLPPTGPALGYIPPPPPPGLGGAFQMPNNGWGFGGGRGGGGGRGRGNGHGGGNGNGGGGHGGGGNGNGGPDMQSLY